MTYAEACKVVQEEHIKAYKEFAKNYFPGAAVVIHYQAGGHYNDEYTEPGIEINVSVNGRYWDGYSNDEGDVGSQLGSLPILIPVGKTNVAINITPPPVIPESTVEITT